jgi:two-component system, chemotaxis family, sensor kinase CheA
MKESIIQNILLVDDHPENLLALESILEGPGVLCIRAGSGEEALHQVLKYDIALILLDVRMPGMDGFETAKLIHGRQRCKHIPIIFITAKDKERHHVFEGYEAGAVDYLFKPIEPEIVRGKVRIFLELDQQRKILEKQNLQLSESKKNTDNILKNVEEGLFLLDRDFRIKPQYSQALIRILDIADPADMDFVTVLRERISASIYQNSKDYLELLYKPAIEQVDFEELNPLVKAEYLDPGSNRVKYLSFNFKRIYYEEQISELIVTVTDLTDQVLLENKLQASEEQSRRQVDLLHILNTEPLLLKEFLQQTEQDLYQLKSRVAEITGADDLECIYREMHSIKGNSSLLEFSYLALKAHQFEEIFKSNAHPLYGIQIDEPALRAILDEMLSTIHDIHSQVKQISCFSEQYNSSTSRSGDLIVKAVSTLVNRLNREYDRQIDFVHSDYDASLIPTRDFLPLKDVLIQMTHNSISHGFETAAERKIQKKNEVPTITLSSHISGNSLILSFMDDGRGIQVDALRERAKTCGKWDEKEIANWTDEQIENIIFVPGITTTKSADLLAGRGMGMDVVRRKVQKLGGEIEINSQPGKFCEFLIRLPLTRVNRENTPEIRSQVVNTA